MTGKEPLREPAGVPEPDVEGSSPSAPGAATSSSTGSRRTLEIRASNRPAKATSTTAAALPSASSGSSSNATAAPPRAATHLAINARHPPAASGRRQLRLARRELN
ncbi:MAG: hypothetical protein HYX53_18295 [Chloroflexi bacterium]|nr:hypothetical protein [Chloroflexota bacterium]